MQKQWIDSDNAAITVFALVKKEQTVALQIDSEDPPPTLEKENKLCDTDSVYNLRYLDTDSLR